MLLNFAIQVTLQSGFVCDENGLILIIIILINKITKIAAFWPNFSLCYLRRTRVESYARGICVCPSAFFSDLLSCGVMGQALLRSLI
jgi:hypothetical protein